MQGSTLPLYNIYCVLHDMLRDRGYIVPAKNKTPEEYALDFYEADTGELHRDRMTMSLIHAQDRTKNIRVFFIALGPGNKVGKKELGQILAHLDEIRTRAIIVLSNENSVTAHAARFVDDMNRSGKVHVQIFTEGELETNQTLAGKLARSYAVLSNPEKEAVLKRYPPSVRKLPVVASNDFLAKYFGMQHQDVLKCVRASETAGMYSTYKLCLYPEEVPKESVVKKQKR